MYCQQILRLPLPGPMICFWLRNQIQAQLALGVLRCFVLLFAFVWCLLPFFASPTEGVHLPHIHRTTLVLASTTVRPATLPNHRSAWRQAITNAVWPPSRYRMQLYVVHCHRHAHPRTKLNRLHEQGIADRTRLVADLVVVQPMTLFVHRATWRQALSFGRRCTLGSQQYLRR